MNRCNLVFTAPRFKPPVHRPKHAKHVIQAHWAALALVIALGGAVAAMPQQAVAQTASRGLPEASQRATLEVTTPPNILLNGQAERLSPGARIRDTNNHVVTPAALAGQSLLVQFVRESNGMVHEVWILSQTELARPAARYQGLANANAGGSNAVLRKDNVKRDDGKTPFDQLPKFPNQ